MPPQSHTQAPTSFDPIAAQPASKYAAETRLLADLERVDWLHAPSPIERLEAAVGNERTSQLLLLLALWPEELLPNEEEFTGHPAPAIQAA
jgi:hypothetical protein